MKRTPYWPTYDFSVFSSTTGGDLRASMASRVHESSCLTAGSAAFSISAETARRWAASSASAGDGAHVRLHARSPPIPGWSSG